ncbi:unnamed protein product [Ambrosiozyma monospora]|uniref:Unnamed protein product n=1 Tax=Ambrosiozyma monospora TaxID=43982 RepID=A0ACB5SRH9_AMBMO|nr:unnamed protein product [Ambrosiozyma monospora]
MKFVTAFSLFLAIQSVSSLPIALQNSESEPVKKFLRLNTYKAAASSSAKRLVRRQNEDATQTLDNTDDQAYYIDLEIGSNKQKVTAQLDTGSSDFFVFGSTEANCGDASKADCSTYGKFDASSSTTFKNLTGVTLDASYGSGAGAEGYVGSDDIDLDGTIVSNVTFGVTTSADTVAPLIGVGYQSLSSMRYNNSQYKNDGFPFALADAGVINIPSYSISLMDHDETDEVNSTVTFGAYDTTRFVGSLYKMPIPHQEGKSTNRIGTILNGISITSGDSSNETLKWIAKGSQFVQLDTGSSLSNMPVDAYDYIGKTYFGSQDSSSTYHGSCDSIKNHTLYFNFLGMAYPVPLTTLTSTYNGDDSQCQFDAVPSYSGTMCILGDNFLKNVYLVVDLKNNEVALGSSVGVDNAATASPNFVEIIGSIPNAVNAPNFDSAWTYNNTDTLSLVDGLN